MVSAASSPPWGGKFLYCSTISVGGFLGGRVVFLDSSWNRYAGCTQWLGGDLKCTALLVLRVGSYSQDGLSAREIKINWFPNTASADVSHRIQCRILSSRLDSIYVPQIWFLCFSRAKLHTELLWCLWLPRVSQDIFCFAVKGAKSELHKIWWKHSPGSFCSLEKYFLIFFRKLFDFVCACGAKGEQQQTLEQLWEKTSPYLLRTNPSAPLVFLVFLPQFTPHK